MTVKQATVSTSMAANQQNGQPSDCDANSFETHHSGVHLEPVENPLPGKGRRMTSAPAQTLEVTMSRETRFGGNFLLLLAVPTIVNLALSSCSSSNAPGNDHPAAECRDNSECEANQICWNGSCYDRLVITDSSGEDGFVIPDAGGELKFDGTGSDVVLVPGELGWPCTDDTECLSEKCIPAGPKQNLCTIPCIDYCPANWSCRGIGETESDLMFYCFPNSGRLCEPCLTDVSCLSVENLCVDLNDVKSCGQACGQNGECPNGYACQKVTSVDGVEGNQCLPVSGSCECTPESAGQIRTCENFNNFGTCFGEQVCGEDGVLTECDASTPEAEVCDGSDNDCDGFIDEDITPVPCEKANAFGTCQGVKVCTNEAGEVCTAAEAEEERCDYMDNDCDGLIDEDFKTPEGVFGLLEHCGGCGESCVGVFAHAKQVECNTSEGAPDCRVMECEPGFILANNKLCIPAFHHLCESCNQDSNCIGPKDRCLALSETDTQKFCGRDCSEGNVYGEGCPAGYTCKVISIGTETAEQCVPDTGACDCSEFNAGQSKPCSITVDSFSCYGTATCEPGLGWTGCTAPTPEPEACDGKDNNCNGIVDEVQPTGCEVTNEYGTCIGSKICLGFGVEICDAETPATEVCDGRDNNCDGQIDEGFAEPITSVDTGEQIGIRYSINNSHCGACNVPCTANAPAVQAECQGQGDTGVCVVTQCQEGTYLVDQRFCLPLPKSNLCLPCSSDSACGGPADQCLGYPMGQYCGRDCSEGSIYSMGVPGELAYCTGEAGVQGCCPDGWVCSDEGDGGRQCRRVNNTCDCNSTPRSLPCSNTNEFGTCFGSETCDPLLGWLPCDAAAASAEVCNGVDDDCDGFLDAKDPSVDVTGLDGYPDCTFGSNLCGGTWKCATDLGGSYVWSCTASVPTDEICDGLDNNCDGAVDDGFVDLDGQYSFVENCGQCGLDCRQVVANLAKSGSQVADGAVACEVIDGQPTCVPKLCEPGYYTFPTGGTPAICLQVQASNCLGCSVSGDCIGIGHECVQWPDDASKACAQRCDSASPFVCQGQVNTQDCCPDGFLCTDPDGTPGGELLCKPQSGTCTCSSFNEGLIRPCSITQGAQTCLGTSTCTNIGGVYNWGQCEASGYIEICDGIDNNCDGIIDEGFVVSGEYTGDTNCGGCGINCLQQWNPALTHTIGACDALAPGGPACAIGACLTSAVAGGKDCLSNTDCATDPAGSLCDPNLGFCTRTCISPSDCSSGLCIEGRCARSCSGNGDCAALGAEAFCSEGTCRRNLAFVNLDGLDGNGCECGARLENDGTPVTDDPDVFQQLPVGGERYVDSNCDGIDGDVASAVFVAEGATFGTGTIDAPFGTITEAIVEYQAGDYSQILVASGIYNERVIIPEGVRIFGGYRSDFLARDVVLYPSVIELSAPAMSGSSILPGSVYISGVENPTVFAGFTVVGYDVPSGGAYAGQASYGLVIEASGPGLVVTNNWVEGGRGANGIAGANGANGTGGVAGANGVNTTQCSNANCSGTQSLAGGPGGSSNSCGGQTAGCPGMNSDGNEGDQAQATSGYCVYPAGSGGGSLTYSGNPAELCKYDCTVSADKEHGDHGSNGTGGSSGEGGTGCSSGAGAIAGLVWSGSPGLAGTAGTPGQGGQGGAAGARVVNEKSSSCTIGDRVGDMGGSGGGGGAGGCGGSGGAAGGSGGAGIAVLIVAGSGGSLPTFVANSVARGVGGIGGAGGSGGAGGTGGPGGFGGKSVWPAWCAGFGGSGGRGGDGGAGGGGGGGCGGPSIGLAVAGAAPGALGTSNSFSIPETTSLAGSGGKGGPSLDVSKKGSDGSSGINVNIRQY